eukprot:gnl/MRDRNA2_/MRDRNA2_122738_c0_seq1.p1 gnl/MRDRNA2_/MRDRNA2_122738_c0~~gnl/MRDRNA2_/MRDRNA2_122738_c0_seq1.p1  ORF type:complete len:386 (-),score=65.52 gnl/MRDRNA2_/MRDRNA2_122738_c0_seq1:150-1307(-)
MHTGGANLFDRELYSTSMYRTSRGERLVCENVTLRRQVQNLEAANRELRLNRIPNRELCCLREKNQALEQQVLDLEINNQRMRNGLLLAESVGNDLDPTVPRSSSSDREPFVQMTITGGDTLMRESIAQDKVAKERSIEDRVALPPSSVRGGKWTWDNVAKRWVFISPGGFSETWRSRSVHCSRSVSSAEMQSPLGTSAVDAAQLQTGPAALPVFSQPTAASTAPLPATTTHASPIPSSMMSFQIGISTTPVADELDAATPATASAAMAALPFPAATSGAATVTTPATMPKAQLTTPGQERMQVSKIVPIITGDNPVSAGIHPIEAPHTLYATNPFLPAVAPARSVDLFQAAPATTATDPLILVPDYLEASRENYLAKSRDALYG